MKRPLAALVLCACAVAWNPLPAAAQDPAPDAARVAALREAIRTDKRAVVEKNMQLTEAEAKKFWPLYDEYQRSLAKITARQNRVVLDYVNAESSMTDANARRLALELLEADLAEEHLRERHFKKLSKVLPAKKAARYLQIENKIRALQRFDLAERVTLVH